MQVMALNSSARTGGHSHTETMLNALVEGMREAGATVEVVELKKKKINYCVGCFTCWSKTPGQCIHKDDMTQELFPQWIAADLCVYASPLFHWTVNAQMKTFIERTLPTMEPYMVAQGGRSAHPFRHQPPAAAFLSVCGFPDPSAFDHLRAYVPWLVRDPKAVWGQIYRAGAEPLSSSPLYRRERKEILEATVQAGREIVADQAVSPETQAVIEQPLQDFESMYALVNDRWRSAIAAGMSPREFRQNKMIITPTTLESFGAMLMAGFRPEAAGDLSCTIQFDFSGEPEGTCHFQVAQGRLTPVMGPAPEPDLTISGPFAAWWEVMSGAKEGAEAFMSGAMRAQGDSSILMRLGTLFGPPVED